MSLFSRSMQFARSPGMSFLLSRSVHLPGKELKLNRSIVVSSDGGTVICWHPQQGFPYEKTRPLPVVEDSLRAGSSVLKVQHMVASEMANQREGPSRYQLGEMFQMPWKHFRPRPGRKYKSPYHWMNAKERDGL